MKKEEIKNNIDAPKISNQEKFWEKRAEKYNNLRWVNEPNYLKSFLSSSDFNKKDIVLDVGTGTGVIANKYLKASITKPPIIQSLIIDFIPPMFLSLFVMMFLGTF